jgi:TonB family protein
MFQKLIFATTIALAIAAAQDVPDAQGVTVNVNGAPLMHRSPVSYPLDVMSKGIQGTVVVQVKLNGNGEVADASILSGPDELRKAVIQSVLSWHFAKELAGSIRTVNIDFKLPDGPVRVERREPQQPANFQVRTVKGVDVSGLPDEASQQLLAHLPVHAGEQLDWAKLNELTTAVKSFDPHLNMALATAPDGGTTVRIAAPGSAPQRIRVGGNVQSAMLVQQPTPVYPPEAKAAGIQGKVQLSAVIGPDGHVQELTVVEGDSTLAKAAQDAVWQWVYKPTLLNGNPVSVQTTIDVNFTLSR